MIMQGLLQGMYWLQIPRIDVCEWLLVHRELLYTICRLSKTLLCLHLRQVWLDERSEDRRRLSN